MRKIQQSREGNFTNLRRDIYKNPQLTPKLMVKDWMPSSVIRTKTRTYTLVISIQKCTGGSSYSNFIRKRNYFKKLSHQAH